jgi:hypothetical protein
MLGPAGRLQAASAPSVSVGDTAAWWRRGALTWRAFAVVAMLSLSLGALLHESLGGGSASLAPSHARGASHEGLLSLPLAAQGPVSAVLGARSAAYKVSGYGGGFRTASPAQRLTATFSREGIAVSSGTTRVGLSVRGIGAGPSLVPLAQAAPHLASGRVVYTDAGLSAWYANGPLGIEQGFTVAQGAPTRQGGTLTLSMVVSGNAHASLPAGGQSVVFSHTGGPVLRYDGLSATDAGGRELRSWLQLRGDRLLVRVDTHGARYPLRIDPLVQDAELSAESGEAGDSFGSAVAVSGNTIVVGAYQYNNKKYEKPGKAYVFVRPADGWATTTKPAAELRASDGEAARANPDGANEAALFGLAVAIDENTIVVGAPEWQEPNPNKNFVPGAAYVFVKPVGGWAGKLTQSAELHPADGVTTGGFGQAVAVSASTVFVSAASSEEVADAGAVYVFEMPGGGWSGTPAQAAKLTTLKSTGDNTQLFAMAATGSTVVAGGQVIGSPNRWEVFIWVRPHGGWADAIASARLVPPSESEKDEFGRAVAISGTTIVVGAQGQKVGSNPGQGAAYVFEEPTSGGWVSDPAPNAELTESDAIEGFSTEFADVVSIAGGTIVVGDPTHYSEPLERVVGSADVFEEPAKGWANATQNHELIPSLEPGAEIGYAVAVSDEEEGAEVKPTIVGGSDGTSVDGHLEQGEAFVFAGPETPPEKLIVATQAATAVGQTGGTLNATVDPNGAEVSKCEFEYGETTAYGKTASCASLPGSGSSPVAVSAALTGLAASTTYHFRIVATNAGGTSDGADEKLTTLAPTGGTSPGGGSPGGGSPGGGGASPQPPVLSGVLLSHKSFRVAKGATAISAKAPKAPLGTSFQFTLSAAAKLQIVLTSRAAGLLHGKGCVAPTAALKAKHAKHCTRTLKDGQLTRASEAAGADSVPFTGRLGTKALPAGAYSAALTAMNEGGSSNTVTVTFKVVR